VWRSVTESCDTAIAGTAVTIDESAVHVTSERQLAVLSSAAIGGGLRTARHIINMHVADDYDGSRPEDDLVAFAARRGVGEPFVGLMTAAETEHARVAVAAGDGMTVAAVVSVGLANTTCAGVTPPMPARLGTINTILLIDAALTPAAMVNVVVTATEAKTMMLGEWDVRTHDGRLAGGTSTDSVVVACTGRGEALRYAGPATTVGWLVARALRQVIALIFEEKLRRDGGRRIGW
jgi:adenosylcobinamide hydrolase